jgi:hypothetical protein
MCDLESERRFAMDAAGTLAFLRLNCGRGTPRWNKHLHATFTILQAMANQEAGDADLAHQNITALCDELKSHWDLIFRDPFVAGR